MDVHRRVIVGVVSLAAWYAGGSYALGLGEVRLDSALNQPLNAIIELHGADGLVPTDISVSLADADAFSRVGIERPYFLTDLRFTPVLVNQQLVVRVESSRVVSEPYLNFLVQLHRPGGLLLREYTLLLDPPLYQPTPVLSASAPVAVVSQPAAERRASRPTDAAAQPILPDLQPQPGAERYQTVAGSSLWAIAQVTRSAESVSVHRQMLAIRALNPDAFVGGDMNRLRTGQTLTLPTPTQVGADESVVAAGLIATHQANIPAGQPTGVSPSASERGRLHIEEPVLQAAAAENEQLYQRLDKIESRFSTLLGELETRDRQIASLQAELDALRRARDAALQEQTVAMEETDVSPVDADRAGATDEMPVAGAIERQVSDLTQPASSTGSWWVVLLALLAAIVGAVVWRLRRIQSEAAPAAVPHTLSQPTAQSTAVAASHVAEPQEDSPHLEPAILDLDGFDLDRDWDVIDELGAKSVRPVAVAVPDFESNLTDFPEIGELDDDFSSHFELSEDTPRKTD